MLDYYEILGVEPLCSQQEIKISFRRKAKVLHPDMENHAQADEFHLLLKAYEILSNPKRRREYDQIHSRLFRKQRFNYRNFLQKRPHDLRSQTELIFFDLLHHNEEQALDLYRKLLTKKGYNLSEYLDYEDYMDCAFILSEEFEKAGEFFESFLLLKQVQENERSRPYFRHFIDEVRSRLKQLLCHKLELEIHNEMVIDLIKQTMGPDFSRKDNAVFYKKIAELYTKIGDFESALNNLNQGLACDKKLTGIKKLKEKIGVI